MKTHPVKGERWTTARNRYTIKEKKTSTSQTPRQKYTETPHT